MIKWRLTSRLFIIGEFNDYYRKPCSIQKSSLIEPCIWLGINRNRMHLSQEQVKKLLPFLKEFAETGELWTKNHPNHEKLQKEYDEKYKEIYKE